MEKFSKEIVEQASIIFGPDNIDLQDRDKTLAIHFPELIIENEEKERHKIYDLFVFFCLEDNKLYMKGARTTFSYAEANVKYYHSHLYVDHAGEVNTFCLGTVMTGLISKYNNESQTEDQFLLILNTLPTYVASESIEGGPYNRTKNIYRGTNFNDEFIIDSSILKAIPKENLTFGVENGEIKCTNINIDEPIINILAEYKKEIFLPGFSKEFNQGISKEYLNNKDNITLSDRAFISLNKYVKFKKERIFVKLVDNFIP
jgi:hypothetical protein